MSAGRRSARSEARARADGDIAQARSADGARTRCTSSRSAAAAPLVLLHGWAMHGGLFAPLLHGARAALIACTWSTCRATALAVAAAGARRARSTRSSPLDARSRDERRRSPCSAGRSGGAVAMRWARVATARGSRGSCSSRRRRRFVARRRIGRMRCATTTLQRFGDELRRRLPADAAALPRRCRCSGSEAGRATLARCGSQLFARGEPSRAALADALEHPARHRICARWRRDDRAPTLVVAGDRATLVPPRGRGAGWRQRCRTRRYAAIAGAAHAPFLSHRDAFVAALRAFPRWPLTRAFPRLTRATSIRARCARAFGRAAATYDAAAVLQREVATRLAERLDYVKLAPSADPRRRLRHRRRRSASSARAIRQARDRRASTSRCRWRGRHASARAQRARCSTGCSRRCGRTARTPRRRSCCADVNALPFAARAAFDLVWSNLALQWVERPAARVRGVPARAQGRRARSRSRRSARTR